MVVECFRCYGVRWHATGRFIENSRGLQRAELVCDDCGYVFASALPAAMEAGSAERGECELPATAVAVPAPTLPIAHVRRDHGFVSTKQLASQARADYRRRQTGESS